MLPDSSSGSEAGPVVEGPDQALYTVGIYPNLVTGPQSEAVIRTTPQGQQSATSFPDQLTVYSLAFGADKRLYAGAQLFVPPTCTPWYGLIYQFRNPGLPNATVSSLQLPDSADGYNYVYAGAMTAGEDGGVWAIASTYQSSTPSVDYLYRISPALQITARYRLPSNTQSQGITWGSDDRLWYGGYGNNRIGRITPTGLNAGFGLPSARSGLSGITVGGDGALWFTESNANKIGRMTTDGHLSEYRIPSPNSAASDIAASPASMNPRAIWFVEAGTQKIGEIQF